MLPKVHKGFHNRCQANVRHRDMLLITSLCFAKHAKHAWYQDVIYMIPGSHSIAPWLLPSAGASTFQSQGMPSIVSRSRFCSNLAKRVQLAG